MQNWKARLISQNSTIKQALAKLDEIGIVSNVLFVTDNNMKLLGSVTDGDIRRGLLKEAQLSDPVTSIMNKDCKRVTLSEFNYKFLSSCKQKNINYIPVITDDETIVEVITVNEYREIISVDAVIMAGGKGERLMPLTKDTPKPMLRIAGKPIIEHNINRLQQYGVRNYHISINYLGHIIQEYFTDGSGKGINISYIKENEPLGTIGSVSLVPQFQNDVVLLMNSDLITNIDFGDFYKDFMKSEADLAIATVPHYVDLPYAILELEDSHVRSLKEKPRYTYFANAGIYLIKKEVLGHIPKGKFYNATDLIEKLLQEERKIFHYPILGYWLDVGRMNDFLKAEIDFKHINF